MTWRAICARSVLLTPGHPIISVDDGIAGVIADHDLAVRVAELLNRHGLVDVSDDISTLTNPAPQEDQS